MNEQPNEQRTDGRKEVRKEGGKEGWTEGRKEGIRRLRRLRDILGLDSTVLDWFQSYLSGCSQQIQIYNHQSTARQLNFGVPQGSVLGPILFLVNVLPLRHLFTSHGFNGHSYADDNQLYVSLSQPRKTASLNKTCSALEECLAEMQTWMTENQLKLNPDKMVIKLFGTQKSLAHANIISLTINGAHVSVTKEPVCNLGVLQDSCLTMTSQINKMVRASFLQLRNISSVRRLLTEPSAKTLVQSLVIPRLDYGNALLCGLPATRLQRLQMVQNQAARLITLTSKHSHITPILKGLHWLPVHARIDFKILLMAFKALKSSSPGYLCELLTEYRPSRVLHSADYERLVVPKSRVAFSIETVCKHSATVVY